jgi:hypothetical protein
MRCGIDGILALAPLRAAEVTHSVAIAISKMILTPTTTDRTGRGSILTNETNSTSGDESVAAAVASARTKREGATSSATSRSSDRNAGSGEVS